MAAREKGGQRRERAAGQRERAATGWAEGLAAEMPDGRRAGVPVGQAGARERLSWHRFCAPTARGGGAPGR